MRFEARVEGNSRHGTARRWVRMRARGSDARASTETRNRPTNAQFGKKPRVVDQRRCVRAMRCDAERELGERAMGGGITRGIAIVQLRWMMMVCLRRLYLMCVCVVGVLIVGLSLRRVV